MSNSPVIPKEKLSAYQRWELHSFDTPGAARPATAASKAEADAEKIRHIHQHAYDAGRADGVRDSAAQAAAAASHIKAVLESVREQIVQINQHTAQEVLDLAAELARQMVRQALAVRPELVMPVIHDALARAAQPLAAATIALHPDDATLVRAHLGEELAAAGWRIIEDHAMARGGAMLQTAATQIDATVESRWKKLTAALGQEREWLIEP